MLTAKENKMLTEVGKGTPMGEFMRRYWIPAAKSEEIPMPGGAPARVRLLGEHLVLFRSRDGELGLIDEFCPHRRASLAYGRNEPGGLRCLYHGWKIACDGRVLESPPEPPARTFAKKLSVASYPVREAGGLIWTYMGPRELEPPFPKFPWLDLPPDQLLVVKMYQATNYLQGVEGDLDPAHPNYLHRDFESRGQERAGRGSAGSRSPSSCRTGRPEIQCEETPYLMRHAAIRKTADPDSKYVRDFRMGGAVLLLHRDRRARVATVQGMASDRRRELLYVLHPLRSAPAARHRSDLCELGPSHLAARLQDGTHARQHALAGSRTDGARQFLRRDRRLDPGPRGAGKHGTDLRPDPRSISAPATRR